MDRPFLVMTPAPFSSIFRRFTETVFFLAPAFVFGSWACLLFRLNLSEELVNLQSPRFHPYTMTAAAVLLALALLSPLLFIPSKSGLSSPRSRFKSIFPVLWLLLPVGAYFILPPSFSTPTALLDRAWATATAKATTTSGTGRVDPATVKNFILKSDAHVPLPLSPTDLLIVQSEPELQKVLKDRQVELLGQWMPMPKGEPNEFRLARLLMVCCAADARPVSVLTQGEIENGAKLGDWYLATGTLNFEDPRETVIFKAEKVEPTDEPEEIFLY